MLNRKKKYSPVVKMVFNIAAQINSHTAKMRCGAYIN